MDVQGRAGTAASSGQAATGRKRFLPAWGDFTRNEKIGIVSARAHRPRDRRRRRDCPGLGGMTASGCCWGNTPHRLQPISIGRKPL